MNEANSKMNKNQPEEVNLFTLFYVLRSAAISLSKKTSEYYGIVERNYKLVLTYTLIGTVIGIIYCAVRPPVYRTHAILTSRMLNNEFSASLITDLHDIAKEDNFEVLSQTLNISKPLAKKVVDIRYMGFNVAKEDSVIGQPFAIEVYVSDNSILDTLQNAIMSYLENNDYALKRKNVKKENLGGLANKITDEIGQLDSLKTMVNKGLMAAQVDKEGKIVGINYINPIDTYKEIIELYQQKLEIVEQMTLMSNYELIQGFTRKYKPVAPRKLRDPLAISCFMFFVGFLVAKRREKKNVQNIAKINKQLESIDA